MNQVLFFLHYFLAPKAGVIHIDTIISAKF